jgi:hypothetical protein
MQRTLRVFASVCSFLVASPLMAQDFGKAWIDRVTHTLIEEESQLTPQQVTWNFVAGELYSYDSNIFLTHSDRENDSIFTTFAGVGVKYAEQNFDAEGDLLINYNAYASNSDADADEERFFGRLRYQGTKVTLSLAEIFRRESSPTDAVFTTRVSRFLSNTTPLIIVKPSEVFAIEFNSDIQLVNYLRSTYQSADNFNTRTLLTLAYTTGWNNMDLLIQGGYWAINYQDSLGPPNASGFIGRLGIRGELSPTLQLIALVGVTSADSDVYPATGEDSQMTTADIDIHFAYTPSNLTTWYADYSRHFGFTAEGASFQVVDSAGFSGILAVREDLKLRARMDYSRVHSDLGLRRAYYDFGVGAEYKVHPHVVLDGSITYRWGVVPGPGTSGDFADAILSVGAALVF